MTIDDNCEKYFNRVNKKTKAYYCKIISSKIIKAGYIKYYDTLSIQVQ